MRILNVEQGSQEWLDARVGRATASNFGRIITPKTGKLSSQADAYIAELVAEQVLGAQANGESFTGNQWTERGTELEPSGRHWYEFERDVTVTQVGMMIMDGDLIAASPDGLVGEDGGLEIKFPKASTHIKYLMGGVLPDEYKAQVHGNLIVSGREWWDFLSFCPGLKPLLIRVEPDDWTEKLRGALDEFLVRWEKTYEEVTA